jgi:hypothetical protein
MSTSVASAVLGFTDTIGVNTHLDALDTGYANLTAVMNALAYLGTDLVRDTIDNVNDPAEFAAVNQDLGITFDFFISPGSAGFDWQVEQIEANPALVAYVEGPNESDYETQYYDSLSGLPATQAEMQALYASVHGDAQLAGVPVIQTSFANVANFAVYGDQAGTADLANVHLYFGTGNNPGQGAQIGTLIQDAQIVTPGAPTIATEAGYYTMPGDPSGVSQIVQAKYLLDMLFDDWNDGITATFLFELVDRQPDAGNTTPNDHYGLFNTDWTPKPAAIALHNLMTILADPGTGGVAPGSLSYTLSGMPSTANSTLLEKSDGTFVLALWNDVRLSGPTSQTTITVASVAVTLTLSAPFQSITVYDPLTGTTAVQSFANAQTVQIMVPDHPVLVEITNTPAAAASTGPIIDAPATMLDAAGAIARVPGLSVSDTAAGFLTVQVTDTVGTLVMQDSNGQALLGSGTSSITLSGSSALVNAELATLAYAAPATGGSDTIGVDVTDSTGATTTDFIPVTTVALPASQTPNGPLLSLPFTLGVAARATVAIPDAVLTDLYYATNPGTLTLTVSAASGTVRMTVNGVALAAASSLTISGSEAAVAAALDTLTYSAPATLGTDTLSIAVTDPAGMTASASLPISVLHSLSVVGPISVHAVAGATTSLGGLQIVDAAAAGNAAQLKVIVNDAAGALAMTGASGTAVAGSGTNSIAITGTPDQVNAELATLTYTPGASLLTESVTIAVSGGGLSGSRAVPITVVPSVVISAPASVPVGNGVIALIQGLAIADSYASGGTIQMHVTVTDLYGALGMVNAAGATLAGSGTHSITLTGTLATVNAELATLTYTGPSYAIGDTISLAATDADSGSATQTIVVPVTAGPALSTYFQVGDTAAHPFARQPFLTSGGMILTAAATGLGAGVTEQVGTGGVVTLASQGWNVVSAVAVVDPSGGSYVLSNFVYAAATLSGGPTGAGQAETLTVNTALQGAITLGTGNQDVTINAGVGGAVPSGGSQFTIAGGSGTDAIAVNGYDGLTQVNATAGSGTDTMTFINTGAVGVVGGAGNDTVHGGNNGNSIVAGSGTMDAWGGTGADAFIYHAGDGVMTIENLGTNDYLFLDKSLQPWLVETSVAGGVALTFANDPAEEVLLKGFSTFPASHITWTGSAGADTPNSAGQYVGIAAPATVASSTGVIVPVTGIALGDAYAAANGLTMTVVVDDTSGLLAMVDGSGNAVAGSGGNEIVLTGSVATVNAELATLTYTGPSYATTDAITIAAADTAGGASTQSISVPVAVATALSTYFQVGDTAGHPFGRQPFLTSGGMILTSAATGLSAGVSEQVGAGGVVTLASQGWNVVNAVSVVDPGGGSYVLSNFVYAAATLSGGPTGAGQAEALTVNTALQGAITLGTGNQDVTIDAGVGGSVPSGGSQFTIAGGSGTDAITVNGYDGLTQVNATAGSGTDTMTFINTGAVGVVGGAGNDTVYGGNNGNSIVAGNGMMDAWGGTGADAFIYHAGDGIMTIENFGTNDYLSIDQSLKASSTETVTGAGVLFQFAGSTAHEILVKGLSSIPSAQLGWN